MNANESASLETVSIVLPNHNHSQYIENAIGALHRQTRQADEIIVIDDASTDDSVALIERLMRGARNIKLLRNPERLGVASSLNIGLRSAVGDTIAFAAADDCLAPNFLAESAAALESCPKAAFATSCVGIRDASKRSLGLRPIMLPSTRKGYINGQAYRRMLGRGDNHFVGSGTLYRRGLLLDLGGFDERLMSMTDGIIARRLAARHGFFFIPKVLGYWILHDYNYSITTVLNIDSLNAMVAAFRKTIESEPAGVFPKGYADLLERRVRFGAARLIVESTYAGSAETSEALVRVVGNSPANSAVVRCAARAGWPGRQFLLAWLTLRLRPFSLTWLAVEPFRRWIALSR